MIAAVYARKSTDQNISDEEKSVTRQVEHAKAYATRKGWTVAEEHVYADDGISGADFVNRAGLTRLLASLSPRPPYGALIMSEQSRLGRELYETGYILKRIIDAGVRVVFYLDDREASIDDPVQKMMLQLAGFAAEMERHQARQRTRDAMQRKASRGHVAGGKVYGYRNVRRVDHVEREIDQAEASIVRRIFEEITQGRGWAMTGVRAIVFRELYRGRIIYGQTRWIDRGGEKLKQDRPESEWLVVEAPALRIVPEELWRTAHDRLERTRQTYVIGGRLGGRPEAGIESRHLLSGFVLCGACEGSMHAIKRTSRRGMPRVYYVCNGWRVNGTCHNSWSLPLGDLDAAVLGALREDVLTPDLVEDVVTRAVELYAKQHDTLSGRRRALEADLRRVEAELTRLADKVATGDPLPTLMDAMRAREQRRADLKGRLEHLDGLARAARPAMTAELRDALHTRLEGWSALLGRNPIEARPILRQLLVGRLVATPRQLPAGRFYEFTVTATYGKLLAGIVGGLVPPG